MSAVSSPCRRLSASRPSCGAGVFPKLAGDLEGVDAGLLPPPRFLVTRPVNFVVMRTAERNGEFIARLAAKSARLHQSDVVGVRRFAAA